MGKEKQSTQANSMQNDCVTWFEMIPESEVPLDIRNRISKDVQTVSMQKDRVVTRFESIPESEVPLDIRNLSKKMFRQ